MVIVELNGGMGNQMFQYALYLKLKSLGKNVKLDNTSRYQCDNRRTYCLEVFDNIDKNYATKLDLLRYRYEGKCKIPYMIKRIFKLKDKVFNEDEEKYLGEVFEKGDCILAGFWQNEFYFREIKSMIIYSFQSKLQLNDKNQKVLNDIKKNNSISIHIRRGDYLEVDNYNMFGNICNEEYYNAAMSYFRKKYQGIVFYFFSNDPQWVKNKYTGEDCIVVFNEEDCGYIDMYLMTFCKHHIIANR